MLGQAVTLVTFTTPTPPALVEISAELRQTAIATIQAVKTLLETGLMPKLFTANAVKDAVCTPNAFRLKRNGSYQEVS